MTTNCHHRFKLDRIEEISTNLRRAHLKCLDCPYERGVLTTKSEVEIRAEAAAEVVDQ